MWNVKAEQIIAAARILNNIPANGSVPSSSMIQVRQTKHGIEMSLRAEAAANISLRGSGEVKLKKPIYINRRTFLPFIFMGSGSAKDFVFEFKSSRLIVTQSRRKANFQFADPATGYLDAKDVKGGTELVLGTTLKDALVMAASYSTLDRPELNSIFMERRGREFKLLTSNQLVAFFSWGKSKKKAKITTFLPAGLIPFLGIEEIKTIRVRDEDIILDFSNGHVWHPLSKKAIKEFPVDSLKKLLSDGKKWPELCRLKLKVLSATLSRFSEYLNSAKKDEWTIELSGTAGGKEVTLESILSNANFKEKMGTDSKFKSDFSVTWPLDILLPYINYLGEDKTVGVFAKKDGPCLLIGKDSAMIISRMETK